MRRSIASRMSSLWLFPTFFAIIDSSARCLPVRYICVLITSSPLMYTSHVYIYRHLVKVNSVNSTIGFPDPAVTQIQKPGTTSRPRYRLRSTPAPGQPPPPRVALCLLPKMNKPAAKESKAPRIGDKLGCHPINACRIVDIFRNFMKQPPGAQRHQAMQFRAEAHDRAQHERVLGLPANYESERRFSAAAAFCVSLQKPS